MKLQFRLDSKPDYKRALKEHFGIEVSNELTRIQLMYIMLNEMFKRDYNDYYSEIRAIINASIKQLKARSFLSVRGLRTSKISECPVEEKLIQIIHLRRKMLKDHSESLNELCPVRVAKGWLDI